MRKILVITSSRADFGILSNLIKQIEKDNLLNLKLLVTGSHLNKTKGSSIDEIVQSRIRVNKYMNLNMKNENLRDTIKICADSLIKYKKIYDKLRPHLILVLGDRFEIYSAVVTAFFSRIPVAHLNGGEVTHAAQDDSLRHSITKLSNIHFVTNREHFKRVIQLGENPARVHLVGSLSSENIKKSIFKSKRYLENKLKFKFKKKYFGYISPSNIATRFW